MPFDVAAARAYGRIYASVVATGRKAGGRRAVDLLIAAAALAAELPLYTCNPDDFAELADVDVIPVSAQRWTATAPRVRPRACSDEDRTPSR